MVPKTLCLTVPDILVAVIVKQKVPWTPITGSMTVYESGKEFCEVGSRKNKHKVQQNTEFYLMHTHFKWQ